MTSYNYINKANELILLAKKYIQEKDWTLISNKNDIRLEKKAFPNICPIDCFRATTLVSTDPEILWNYNWNENENQIKERDPDVQYWKIIEVEQNYKVFTQLNKMKWPLWSREIVCAKFKIKDKNEYYIINFSIEHPEIQRKDSELKKYVRANVHISFYGFWKENDKTRVWQISHIDPEGMIPNSVVNMYADRLIKQLERLKNR